MSADKNRQNIKNCHCDPSFRWGRNDKLLHLYHQEFNFTFYTEEK